MATVAENLQTIIDSKAAIKAAIEAKGVAVGDAPLTQYASKIEEISGGQEEAPENDVNFYDYTGFRVASFTIEEAKALTQEQYDAILPPTHEGLTFQEWNWTLADIQGYNRRYINIGANYVPTDGKTHIKFCPKEAGAKLYIRLNPTLKSKPVVIDWGDGTSSEYSAGTDGGNAGGSHTYEDAGEYDITVWSKNADVTFSLSLMAGGNSDGIKWVKGINTGNEQKGVVLPNIKIILSIAKQLTRSIVLGRSSFPVLVVPRETQWDFSFTDCLNNALTITCFPKVVPSFAGMRVYGNPKDGRCIIPEIASGGIFAASSITGNNIAYILSLPLSLQFASQPASNVWVSMYSLDTLDIVQGWIPNYGLVFSASTNYDSFTMVDFFNKLGTTSNTITLSFGSNNLNKLTEDQKAIATNKGYTLA
jgi:hypothetical protein